MEHLFSGLEATESAALDERLEGDWTVDESPNRGAALSLRLIGPLCIGNTLDSVRNRRNALLELVHFVHPPQPLHQE